MQAEDMRRSAKILIVDDEERNILLLRRVLERAGFQSLTSTTDARQAIPLFESLQPDLLLLDLNMPHVSGFQILESLRGSLPAGSYIPVLVLTANATAATRARALALGARDYLTKPLDITETLLRINNLLETRFLYLQLHSVNTELFRQTRELQRFVSLPTFTMIQAREQITSGIGELRDFAILFSDMRGFTEMAHRLEPTAAFQILSRSLEIQTGIILRFAGQVDKIYGDGFLAYFGGDDRIQRAVHCAVSIRTAVQAMERPGDIPVPPVGFGINAGSVLFGMLGTNDRIDHTLVGDAVNVCARLCGFAKPFQIVVTEDITRAFTEDEGITFRPLGPVTLKGKPDPMPVFEVISVNDFPQPS